MQKLRNALFCKRGFTLIEIMATVAILSFGILAIFESFFISMDAFGYYSNYLTAHWWINEKIWELENKLMQEEYLKIESGGGVFKTANRNFRWSASVNPVDEANGVYKLDVSVYWQEGKRERFVYRGTYASRQISTE